MKRALFIDRDGIINRMVRYKQGFDTPLSEGDVSLVSGIDKIIRFANKLKIPVIEISNQPAFAKGKISKKISIIIEKRIHFSLGIRGVKIDAAFICPHHPKAVIQSLAKKCLCRKPAPGLLFKAAKKLNLDLSKSIFLGDKASDILAGKAAGVKTIIFLHHDDEPHKVNEAKKVTADYKVNELEEAMPILREFF